MTPNQFFQSTKTACANQIFMLIVLSLFAAHVVQAQQNNYMARVRRLTVEIKVDGRLSEPVWSEIEPITNFTQTEPDEGKPATERTEARIFYDNRKLYFGFRCYDSDFERTALGMLLALGTQIWGRK